MLPFIYLFGGAGWGFYIIVLGFIIAFAFVSSRGRLDGPLLSFAYYFPLCQPAPPSCFIYNVFPSGFSLCLFKHRYPFIYPWIPFLFRPASSVTHVRNVYIAYTTDVTVSSALLGFTGDFLLIPRWLALVLVHSILLFNFNVCYFMFAVNVLCLHLRSLLSDAFVRRELPTRVFSDVFPVLRVFCWLCQLPLFPRGFFCSCDYFCHSFCTSWLLSFGLSVPLSW